MLWALILMFMGCQGASGVSTSLLKDKDITFRRLAVMPFQYVAPEVVATYSARSSLPASVLKTDNAAGSHERYLQDLFLEMMSRHRQFDLVSPDRVGGTYEGIGTGSLRATLPQALREAGKELGADGIVVGYLYRWRERRGYDYSVEKPASVFFEIHLYRVLDGALAWKGVFDKTQKSLMENVMGAGYFVKDRGRWLTAKELAAEGMAEIVGSWPGVGKETGKAVSRSE
ncbi:MAG TPA: hypothetical protein PL061_01230 [Syntrophales bacterium]|nr:hypothetical protein [Syntrophales bacterium]